MLKNYLSIGEVSKIKGVSVKSLRYYGELGILPPVYINPETGYRYYSIDQLVIVDLITICIDLDIPLKNFNGYLMPEGYVDIGKLFADGENIVAEKIKNLNASVSFLSAMSKHIKRTNQLKMQQEESIEHFPQRYFLTADWNGNLMDYKGISTKYTRLFQQCKDMGITDQFNQGVIFWNKNGSIIPKVFIEVSSAAPVVENLLYLDEGDYACKAVDEEGLFTALEQPPGQTLIVKELFDLKIEPSSGLLEMERKI